MGVTQIKEWFNRFKNGCTSVDGDQRSGRLQTARNAAVVERVENLVMEESFDHTRDFQRSWEQ